MAERDQQPPVGEQSEPVGSGADNGGTTAASPEPASESASRYGRLRKWVRAHPEKAGNLALGIGAIVTAAASVIVAIVSLYVASQALNDQRASDQLARDTQIRSFASKVSLSGASAALSGPAATIPDVLNIENLNNEPVGATYLVIGVNANVQFSDGLAYTNAISWRNVFNLSRMGPCSKMTLQVNNGTGTDVGNDPELIFIDDNDLIWYREASGVLVQLILNPVQLKQFFAYLSNAPVFSRSQVNYQNLTSCS